MPIMKGDVVCVVQQDTDGQVDDMLEDMLCKMFNKFHWLA